MAILIDPYRSLIPPANGLILLPNGTVFCGPVDGVARIYDPATEIFTPTCTGFLGSGYMVLLADDNVLLYDLGKNPNTFQIYNPTLNSVKRVAQTSRYASNAHGGIAKLPDGRVFLAQCNSDKAVVYNPVTDSFADVASPVSLFNQALSLSCVCLLDGRVFAPPWTQNAALLYNPATNSMIKTNGSYPITTPGGAGATMGGCILDDGRVYMNSYVGDKTWIYDPTTNTTVVAGGGVPLYGGSRAVTLPNGKVFIPPTKASGPGVIYDPVTNLHSHTADIFQPVNQSPRLLFDGRVMLCPEAGQTSIGFYGPKLASPLPASRVLAPSYNTV